MKPLLIVLVKDPVQGRVKTRLGAIIGDSAAAAIYRAMVTDLLEMWMRGEWPWDVEIHVDGESGFYERFPFARFPQAGADLGERLYHCLSSGLERGAGAVTVIGSDAPALRPEWVAKLGECDADVALGPTDDGGYWGIRVVRTSPGMFQNVRWSTDRALMDTVQAAHAAGLSTAFGPRGWDVDTAEDLDRLIQSGCVGPHTAAVLTAWRESEGRRR
ncbi:MAG: TIGR04282 family arsenosugar biosynthesis glycosyltransferase [Bryobacterales bacterium]|nr:TIGR04282 family arsenosugar biosynthesis glycosyltransferase [Bryobacterales bacterium]